MIITGKDNIQIKISMRMIINKLASHLRQPTVHFLLLTVFFTLWMSDSNRSFAQGTSVYIGSQIPLFYSAGFEYEANQTVSFSIQGGLLTKPYNTAILHILEELGTRETLVNTIGESFSHGVSVQSALKFHFRNYYAGLLYSYYLLIARDTPIDAMENFYGFNFPINFKSKELNLHSRLSNIGLLAGRKFMLNNSGLSLNLEFSVAKTVASRSTLYSESGDVNWASETVDKKLNTYYLEYGYLPSLNIYLVKSF